MPTLDAIRIAGFKSIRDQEVQLRRLNVLIGANGAGKSNFIGVFRLLRELVDEDLALHVAREGGANSLLHFGRKTTEELALRFEFGPNAYSAKLVPTHEDTLIFKEESAFYLGHGYSAPYQKYLGAGHRESQLPEAAKASTTGVPHHVLRAFKTWQVYHFHDTSASARVKQTADLNDNHSLRPDAGNLASFLYRLQERDPGTFANISDTVRMAAPFFGGFALQPDRLNPEKIRLEWREHGSDQYFNAHALSDGTLRFISLATLLLQPEPPKTILIDEPELGLHPYAITLLAELLGSASERTQLIVSTQSVTLVNRLQPEDLLIVDRQDGASVFRRLTEDHLASWLDDYALGELWEKNLLGGRPAS